MTAWATVTDAAGSLLASPCHLVTVSPCHLLLSLFPRGEGFFFHPGKLLAVIVLYLIWVKTIAWVDKDIQKINMPRETWNFLLFGCCAAGLLLVWLIPIFGVSFLLLILLYLSPTLVYVSQRNEKVPPDFRVLTRKHLQAVWKRALGGKLGAGSAEPEEKRVPVKFIGKSFDQREEDQSRVQRASESAGYRAAQELVHEALNARATDIHLEPTRDEMLVRFRVDSMLHAVPSFSRQRGESVLNIFKVLAGLDITEKRKPQDGSFSAEVEERTVDFRVATAGSVNGEKMVMRILDSGRSMTSLSQIGLRESLKEKLNGVIHQSYGMLITCGPTGAGKTSTLYACIGELDRFQRNIITLENPVEYHIDNVTQIEVNPKAGKTFATELRSILRQDPDVILVGEIRDAETAEIACQAAQTGHMVFSTLHANDAVTAIGRLIDLGVKPFMVAGSLSAVMAQRLIRVLCPKCKVPYKPPADLLKKLRLPADKIKHFYRPPEEEERPTNAEGDPKVCSHCKGTGWAGRTGIFEFLLITDEIREMIRQNPDLQAIKQAAAKSGMHTLFEDGLRKVIEGKTSLAELHRVAK